MISRDGDRQNSVLAGDGLRARFATISLCPPVPLKKHTPFNSMQAPIADTTARALLA